MNVVSYFVVSLITILGVSGCNTVITPSSNPQDEFVIAAIHGDVKRMQALSIEGVDINGPGFDSHYMNPALIQAAGNGHMNVVLFLLENGADVNVRGRDGLTPLMLASDAGHLEIVRVLLNNGADVNAVNSSGETALTYAIDPRDPHLEIVELLRQAGAK